MKKVPRRFGVRRGWRQLRFGGGKVLEDFSGYCCAFAGQMDRLLIVEKTSWLRQHGLYYLFAIPFCFMGLVMFVLWLNSMVSSLKDRWRRRRSSLVGTRTDAQRVVRRVVRGVEDSVELPAGLRKRNVGDGSESRSNEREVKQREGKAGLVSEGERHDDGEELRGRQLRMYEQSMVSLNSRSALESAEESTSKRQQHHYPSEEERRDVNIEKFSQRGESARDQASSVVQRQPKATSTAGKNAMPSDDIRSINARKLEEKIAAQAIDRPVPAERVNAQKKKPPKTVVEKAPTPSTPPKPTTPWNIETVESAERKAREAERNLKRQQDDDYEKSLRADEERKRLELERVSRMEEAVSRLGHEPSSEDSATYKLKITLPDGFSVVRRFYRSDPASLLLDLVTAHTGLCSHEFQLTRTLLPGSAGSVEICRTVLSAEGGEETKVVTIEELGIESNETLRSSTL